MKKTIPVIGMACSVCSANVEKKLQSLEGINSASVSLASRTALVDYDPDIISLEDMKREISNAGYDLVIENDRSVEEINRREFTLLRRRTLASWIFAILTMCFSMGWISLGMEQNMISDGVASAHHSSSFANQICLLLALANLLYCGKQFYISAWKQLLHHTANMDSLVALSTLIAFLFSTFNTFFGEIVWGARGIEWHTYFDASVMIITFVLTGRCLEEKAKDSTASSIRQLMGMQPKTARLVTYVTKITATLPAIIKLYDSRKINLAAPLSDYYPPLKETDKKDITVQEVLCHNAGLKTFLPLFTDAIDPKSLPGPLFTSKRTAHNTTRLKDRLYVNLNYRFKDSTVSNSPKPGYKYMEPGLYMFPAYQDTIRSCILHSPLNPKKEYAYSDLGFILLKFAVEHVTEKSLDQYCQEEFYRKLGMHHTDFLAHKRLNKNNLVPSCVDKLYRKTELKGYVHDPVAALLGGIAGHAGLFSTAEDLAKMMQLYLNGGTYGGEYYFSPETMATFSCKNNLFPKNRRGLGFDKPEPDQTKINPVSKCLPLTSFGHTGFTGIMAWCDPDNKLLYLFLSNRTYPDEFNTKLSEMNIRTQIQDIIYQALEESKIRYN